MSKPLVPSLTAPPRRDWRRIMALAALCALWLTFTLPIVLASEWFPLDMPALFHMGGHLDEWLLWILSPHNGSGRYFPVYWMYWCSQYLVFGASVWPYLLLQIVGFTCTALLLCRMLQRMTGSWALAALLFGALFVNTPTAENLATIGKGEPLSLLFLAAILGWYLPHAYRCTALQLRTSAAIAVSFALAIWAKETSLILLGFAVCGAALAWLLRRSARGVSRATPRAYAGLTLALGAGWLLSKIPYVAFTKANTAANYTDYKLTLRLMADNAEFYLHQQTDVLFCGLLALVLGIFLIVRLHRFGRHGGTELAAPGSHSGLVFVSALIAAGWAYCFAMVVWRWPMAYYMLFPSAVFKLALLYLLWALAAEGRRARLWARIGTWATAIVVLASGTAVYYIVGSQIEYSRIYTSALQRYNAVAEPGHSLVIESYPFFAEQVGGSSSLLRGQMGNELPVTGISEVLDPQVLKPDLLNLLKVQPQDLEDNIQKLPRRGDFVLVFTGEKRATWFLRGVTPFVAQDSMLLTEGMYDMDLVAEESVAMPAVYRNVWTGSGDWGRTWLGYKLYRVTSERTRYLWRGRFPDGWVGQKASLELSGEYKLPAGLRLSAPAMTLPNRMSVFKDGKLLREINFTDANEVTLELGMVPAGGMTLSFQTDKYFVPRDLKLSKDERQLAARVSLSPAPNAGISSGTGASQSTGVQR